VIPTAFDYERATSLDDALVRLWAADGAAKILAGGHSLLPLMKLRLSEPPRLIDIARLRELRGIREQGGRISIGAATTHHEVASSELLLAGARSSPKRRRRLAISRCATAGPSAGAWRTRIRPPTCRRRCWRSTPRSSSPAEADRGE
jgi:hypothetical protein